MSHHIKKIFNIIKCFLLLSAVLCLTTLLLWIYAPESVQNVDKLLVDFYVSYHNKIYNKIVKNGNKPTSLIRRTKLEALLTDLSNIKKGDRLDPLKRKVFNKLIKENIKNKDFSSANQYHELLIGFDGRDLRAQIGYAKFLSTYLNDHAKADSIIKNLYRIIPESALITDAYGLVPDVCIETILDQQNFLKAFLLIYQKYKSIHYNKQKGWIVFWAGKGEGFVAKKAKKTILYSSGNVGEFHFEVSIPINSNLARFRIDPPPNSFLTINKWNVTFSDGKETLSHSSQNTQVLLHDMLLGGNNTLTATGDKDPQFHFILGKTFKSVGEIKIKFYANISTSLDVRFKGMVSQPSIVEKLTHELKKMNRNDEIKFLHNYLQRH